MDITAFQALVLICAPLVNVQTAQALAMVESGLNAHAIGVVGGGLLRQPKSRVEAVATARALHAEGWNFSVGLTQINVRNFERLGLSIDSAFDPCVNLRAMQTVLGDCVTRASSRVGPAQPATQLALRQGLSCYYSGNFATGFKHGYVQRVLAAAARLTPTAIRSLEAR
ncbi:MAG TPA: lytic transglycosylase domain-containing protein [Methylibium sp.]|uniref:lytic transglycosylase domain-containing protein n=1 Tax=Methylibium sp. TaxID=2067992 RepID=UPI002DB80521|nr:lytic transglycosylase domain-containing protein [Methylibium sp.]HEU4459986.1 lytic transglycosylase domain-containing protein [Methylibium sp.]